MCGFRAGRVGVWGRCIGFSLLFGFLRVRFVVWCVWKLRASRGYLCMCRFWALERLVREEVSGRGGSRGCPRLRGMGAVWDTFSGFSEDSFAYIV